RGCRPTALPATTALVVLQSRCERLLTGIAFGQWYGLYCFRPLSTVVRRSREGSHGLGRRACPFSRTVGSCTTAPRRPPAPAGRAAPPRRHRQLQRLERNG